MEKWKNARPRSTVWSGGPISCIRESKERRLTFHSHAHQLTSDPSHHLTTRPNPHPNTCLNSVTSHVVGSWRLVERVVGVCCFHVPIASKFQFVCFERWIHTMHTRIRKSASVLAIYCTTHGHSQVRACSQCSHASVVCESCSTIRLASPARGRCTLVPGRSHEDSARSCRAPTMMRRAHALPRYCR